MDDLFDPPGAPWRRVSPGLARSRRTLLVVGVCLLLAAVAAAASLGLLPRGPAALAAAALLAAAAVGWRWIGGAAARWGYLERADDLVLTSGFLFRRLVVVPYGRMQYVDVQAGPLDRAFGIARIQLHTASPGTAATVPGLPAAEARRLRDRLTSLGEAQAAGL